MPNKNNNPPSKKNGLISQILDVPRYRLIVSLVLSLSVWMYVTMIVQPSTTQEITKVPVDFTYGALSYTQQGLSIVNDPEYYVTVVAEGDGYVIGSLGPEDFTVYPDYSSVRGSGSASLRLNVKCNANTGGTVNVELKNKSTRVEVVFDTVGELTLPITVQHQNVTVADGYIIEKTVALPAEVTLTGPTGELSNVAQIVAEVTLGGELSENTSVNVPLRYLTEEGREVPFTYVTSEYDEVEVALTVHKLAEIPIAVNFINTPLNFDATVLQYTLSQETLEVSGPAALVDKMGTLNVGTLDLSTFALDRVYELPITLPEGVVSQENVQVVTVGFDSSGLATKILHLPAEAVEVVNLPNSYQLEVVSERIMNVVLCGPADVLEGLTVRSVVARIDAEDLSIVTGQQNIAVSMYVPSSPKVFAIGTYTVQCRITSN